MQPKRPAPRPGRTILVVDDEDGSRQSVVYHLRDCGYTTVEATNADEGLAILHRFQPSIVVSDIRMSGMDGIDLLKKIKGIDPQVTVILMTAHGSVEDAVRAMKSGAEEYLIKPLIMEHVEEIIRRAVERIDLKDETRALRRELEQVRSLDKLVGSSSGMRQVFKLVEQVAPSTANVLIYGESGTGKELIGEAIHKLSGRNEGPFIRVNCAVFTETLLESELFGHEKGAFTGAYAQRKGRFELAHRGTLFLDDIAVMPEATQVKILRFLQEREFERVGGTATIAVDVRVIAASNVPLEKEVAAGRFREDLYYRLNVIPITLPPLRERRSDIPLLIEHFIRKYSAKNGKTITGMTDEAMDRCVAHEWPGNVRELENVIERAVVLASDTQLGARHLPFGNGLAPAATGSEGFLPGRSLREIEREAIERTVEYTQGSTTRAARILGISARKIQYRLREYRTGGQGGRG